MQSLDQFNMGISQNKGTIGVRQGLCRDIKCLGSPHIRRTFYPCDGELNGKDNGKTN